MNGIETQKILFIILTYNLYNFSYFLQENGGQSMASWVNIGIFLPEMPRMFFQFKTRKFFQDHPMKKHPLSSVLFENEPIENLDDSVEKENLTGKTGISVKEKTSKEQDLVNFLSSMIFENGSEKDLMCSIEESTESLDEHKKESNIELPDSEIKMGVASSGGLPHPPHSATKVSYGATYVWLFQNISKCVLNDS